MDAGLQPTERQRRSQRLMAVMLAVDLSLEVEVVAAAAAAKTRSSASVQPLQRRSLRLPTSLPRLRMSCSSSSMTTLSLRQALLPVAILPKQMALSLELPHVACQPLHTG